MSFRMLSRQVLSGGRRAYMRNTGMSRTWMPHAAGAGFGDDRHEHQQPTSLRSLPLAVQQCRALHTSAPQDSAVLLVGGVGLAVAFVGLHYAVEGVNAIQARRAEGKPIFARSKYGTKFYEGGFEDDMTRREAALILGVRESADKARVQKAYRRLLTLNHPDTGGSTFIATKINEAKDMLLSSQ